MCGVVQDTYYAEMKKFTLSFYLLIHRSKINFVHLESVSLLIGLQH